MQPHDVQSVYQAKVAEYLIAVAYLLLFVPFWRYVQGGKARRAEARAAAARRPGGGLFDLGEGLAFHPGHAWVRLEGGLATVGLDDFARKLVGPLKGVGLPPVGAMLRQGERGWSLAADSQSVEMLSPLDGTVVEVNPVAAASPGTVSDDPYGAGWLLKLRRERPEADAKQLLAGELARRWMEGVEEQLRRRASPGLGLALQDGGQPVNGLARELEPQRWNELARAFLLT